MPMTASLGEALAAGKGAIRTHPADRPGDLVGARLQPAMGFVEALGDVELLPGGAGEIVLRLGPKRRLVLLYWQQIVAAAATIASAMAGLQAMASMETSAPSRSNWSSSLGITTISFSFSSTASWARTRRELVA